MYPTSAVIIVGSITDVGLLAAAYARGAQGLLFWDPTRTTPEPGGEPPLPAGPSRRS